MPVRSQAHKLYVQGVTSGGYTIPPAITGVSPDTATIANVGTVGRTIATLSSTGGTAPFVYTVANAATMSLIISGNLLNSNANPIAATTGVKTASIISTDARGQTLTETLAVTLT